MVAPAADRDDSLHAAYAECRRVTREHAKSFYFCAQFLPASKREAIYAVYALCRHVDDIVDKAENRSDEDTRTLLDTWRHRLREPGPDDTATLRAWRHASATHGIDPRLAEDLMSGVVMDLTTTRYATYAELERYCYLVASVVGLMTSEIFGYSDPHALDHAIELGRAMQLTNICRDVGEDARLGRIYLPADEMARFGVTDDAIIRGRVDEPFVELMRCQIARARALYRAAEPGIDMLDPGCRYTVRLSSRIYGQILDRIERNGFDSLSRRAFVPFHRKVATLPAVWIETRFRGDR